MTRHESYSVNQPQHPLGPSYRHPNTGQWVQQWSNDQLLPSVEPGRLRVLPSPQGDAFARELPDGNYAATQARPLEGWGLAMRHLLAANQYRNLGLLAKASIGVVKALKRPSGKAAAIAAEAALLLTPIPGDEILTPAATAGIVALGALKAVATERSRLNCK